MPLKANAQFYDYIISGAGCAGLSLAMHMISSGRFSGQKILIIDKDPKNKNDRTWCFWEKGAGLFEHVVKKRWQQFWLHGTKASHQLSVAPYEYKLIRGIDFYEFCLFEIAKQPNIHFLQAGIEDLVSNKEETYISVGGEKIYGRYIFNSILKDRPTLAPHHYWLLQHFRGWLVKADKPAFDPSSATFMDFRTDQSNGTTFFYVLPFDEKRALIEYTLFSKELLPGQSYDTALNTYIQNQLGLPQYSIEEVENGVIPMTNYPFMPRRNNIINIGTAGGQTKASSGFTFRFIQKHVEAIVNSLVQNGHPFSVPAPGKRFLFYDSVLLRILEHNKLDGAEIFSTLFDKNKITSVLKFLDNETSLAEELGIISTLPTLPFLRSAIGHLTQLSSSSPTAPSAP